MPDMRYHRDIQKFVAVECGVRVPSLRFILHGPLDDTASHVYRFRAFIQAIAAEITYEEKVNAAYFWGYHINDFRYGFTSQIRNIGCRDPLMSAVESMAAQDIKITFDYS